MKKGDEIIAYKVVGKRNRNCSNVTIFKNSDHYCLIPNKKRNTTVNDIEKYISENPKLFPVYTKGVKLKALKNTEGFYVFIKKYGAFEFIDTYNLHDLAMIIKVKGIVYKTKPKMINGCGGYPLSIKERVEIKKTHEWVHVCNSNIITLSKLEILT